VVGRNRKDDKQLRESIKLQCYVPSHILKRLREAGARMGIFENGILITMAMIHYLDASREHTNRLAIATAQARQLARPGCQTSADAPPPPDTTPTPTDDSGAGI
jgi:hypothetical protein